MEMEVGNRKIGAMEGHPEIKVRMEKP